MMIFNWRQNVFERIVLAMFSAYQTLYLSASQHDTITPVVICHYDEEISTTVDAVTDNQPFRRRIHILDNSSTQLTLAGDAIWRLKPGWMVQVTACCQVITRSNIR